eukprot:scaffold9191_cov114-Cylindrotheca_fusiformis.AAC.19
MRREVSGIIKDLQEACRRSLYNGNFPSEATTSVPVGEHHSPTKRQRREMAPKNARGWDKILAEAASLLPCMTEYEHGQVSRLAAILLLGFLLPHSTGNEFFLLQNLSSFPAASRVQAAGLKTRERNDMLSVLINMPLAERLQMASQKYNPDGFGELGVIVHEETDQAFLAFLNNGIRPFLNQRPAHTQQVDLLHVLAMAIHPHPQEQAIRQTVSDLEEKEDNEIWTNTKLLMRNMVAHSFQIHYQHRLALVRIVTDYLVLPEYSSENKARPLFDGAIPHLRASLYDFGLAAMSPYDAHWAQCGLVAVSIQTRHMKTVKEEWGRLLNRMVDDTTDYTCCHRISVPPSFSLMLSDSETDHKTSQSFCPHQARGHLLKRFLTNYSQSRHHAEIEFLQYALGSLTEAIEWLVECWTKESDDDEDDNDGGETRDETGEKQSQGEKENAVQTTNDPPCVLASLLFAAKNLFYFLLPVPKSDATGDEETEESRSRDMLVSCGIQLIHHSERNVAREASDLLVLAFCYGSNNMITDYLGAVFESTKLALDQAFAHGELDCVDAAKPASISIKGIISTIAHKSESYADEMLSYLLSSSQQNNSNIGGNTSKFEALGPLIAAIASASPLAATKHLYKVLELTKSSVLDSEAKRHLAVAVLACRRVLSSQKDELEKNIVSFLSATSLGWDHYLIARHAMITGNFDIARALYQQVSQITSSELNYLWISVLEQVASAEEALSTDAAEGIPIATERLRSATSLMLSLPSFSESPNVSFAFQMSFVRLRLEFLDLLVTVRQLIREMRLTCVGPKKNTRPSLHLHNCVKFFNVLALKYMLLYRRHGLFIDQQSRTCLRNLYALCGFVARAANKAFLDVLQERKMNQLSKMPESKGDVCNPLTVLIRKLDTRVLSGVDSSVDPTIRAAAMLEIVDRILGAPFPFPRDFTLPNAIPCASMKLSADSDSEDIDADYDLDDEVDVPPGASFTFFVSGSLPSSLQKRSKIPFSTVLLWHTIAMLEEVADDEAMSEETPDPKTQPVASFSTIRAPPTPASTTSNGAFFMKVECPALTKGGLYKIQTRLGCRDVRGGEWELPTEEGNHSVLVRVARSKN